MSRARFAAAGALVVAAALCVRAHRLGLRPFHHDEAIHGYDSFQLARAWTGEVPCPYDYNPTYHGPLLYYLTGAVFALAGDGETTARAVTVALGVLLVAAILLLRRELGDGAALTAALLVAASPFQIYFSRFLRHDAFVVLETLLFYALFFRGMVERRLLPGLLGVAFLALAFATMENAYIVALVFAAASIALGLFKVLCRAGGARGLIRARGLSRRRLLALHAADVLCEWPGMVQGLFALLAFATFNLMGALLADSAPAARAAFGGALITIIGGCALLPLYMAMRRSPRAELETLARVWRAPALGAVLFGAIFIAAYSNFFVHLDRLGNGLFAALQYWSGQQKAPRLDGPFLYYVPLLLLHEPVVLLVPLVAAMARLPRWLRAAILATGYLVLLAFLQGRHAQLTAYLDEIVRRLCGGRGPLDLFAAAVLLLTFARASYGDLARGDVALAFTWLWSAGMLLIYAWAREKVPWLTVHMELPLSLLTAMLLRRARPWLRALVVALALVGAAHSRAVVVAGGEVNVHDPIVYVQTLPDGEAMARRLDAWLAAHPEPPLLLQDDATVPFYWYVRHRHVLYPKTVDAVAPGQPVLAAAGHEGKALERGMRRRRVLYYGWEVHDWGDTGMGLDGVGALCDWLPRYLLWRDATPFRRGYYEASLFLPAPTRPRGLPISRPGG